MLLKSKPFYTTILLLLFFLPWSKAQVEVFSKNALEKIKNGHTHILPSNNFPGSDGFLEVFQKYWTLTKGVDLSISNHLVDGDSYFSLETEIINNGSMGTAVFQYLNLWIPSENALKRGRSINNKDEISIAHIQLSMHGDIGKRMSDYGGYINNWTPGTLKNYLQQLSAVLQTGKKFLSDDITNKDQLKLLKNQTLYCPDDDFYTMTTFGRTGKYDAAEMTDLFSGYKSSYKVITSRELEDKILADTEPFYYLLYLHGTSSGKLIVVVNSRTGELIYSYTEKSFSHNIKSSDLKDIYKIVKKD